MGSGRMQPVLLTVIGVIAYIFGLLIIITVTPRLLKLNFDEGLFMGIAAADVFGGILAFAPVGITFALFNGTFGIKILDFYCLYVSSLWVCACHCLVFAPVTRGGRSRFHVYWREATAFCFWRLLSTPLCCFSCHPSLEVR